MEQSKINQFYDSSNLVENDLQKGSNQLLNQIKNYNTLDKKISCIQSINLKNEEDYTTILNGILYGMLFDENMNIDSYFRLLFAINYDSYRTFFKILLDFLEFSNIKQEKFDKIFQIFERFIKINVDKKNLIEMLLLITRNVYPGQDLTYSIVSFNNLSNKNNNNNVNNNEEENFTNNYFYKFLMFIKANIEFILENSININLTGLMFIKILRLLTETQVYHNIYKTNNSDNSTDLSNSNISDIANTYEKIGFSDRTKKLIGEIYDSQIYILTKLYSEKKEKVLETGKELIRLLISLGKSNIEIINTVWTDLTSNDYYEKIINLASPDADSNMCTQINIPPLMERMIIYILTQVKKSSLTYQYYFGWMFKKFKIENCIIDNTILVDIARFIITNFFYYRNYTKDFIPRWQALCYIFKQIKNHIISSEIKQAFFIDLILFDKEKNNFFLIEPPISSIIYNMKDFSEMSEELIEFLESYAKHFDNNNSQKRINSVCDAFQTYFKKNNLNVNDIEKSIRDSSMDIKYKNILINIIKQESIVNKNKNNNINNNQNESNNRNITNTINNKYNNINPSNNINDSNNNDILINANNNIFLNQLNEKESIRNKPIAPKDNKRNKMDIDINKNNAIDTNNKNSPKNTDKSKEINIEITIPKEMNIYIQKNTLKNFIKEKNAQNFNSILIDICNYNIKTFGKSDSSLKILDSSYKSLCSNFADFFIKIFKDELEFKDFDTIDYSNHNDKEYIYTSLLDYTYEKNNDTKTFSFMADLINKIIDIYPIFILHLMSYVLNETINQNINIKKNNYNGIYFFKQLNNKDIKLMKKNLKLFFEQCEENFLMFFINYFFKIGGVEFFNQCFCDEEDLIFKILRDCDLNCINTVKMSIMNNNFILIDKKFTYLCKFSFRLSPSEKNIFWNLVFAQGQIPSLDLENFLKFCIDILINPPTNISKDEIIQINYDEFFDKVINSIFILFKKEIYTDINGGKLDNLGKKCIYMLDFNISSNDLKRYIYHMIDSFLNNFLLNEKDGKKLFYSMAHQYFKENNKNLDKLRNFWELLNYFLIYKKDIMKNNNKDINNFNNIGWITDDIKNLINNIIKTINQISIS